FLEAVVLAVPHRHGEVEEPVPVTEPGDAVLAPSVGPPVRLVERERRPRVTVGRVVLTDGPPLSSGHVRPPEAPWVGVVRRLRQSCMLDARSSRLPAGRAQRHGAYSAS